MMTAAMVSLLTTQLPGPPEDAGCMEVPQEFWEVYKCTWTK